MPDASGNPAIDTYGEITRLVERLHRRYLDVVRYELSRLKVDDITAVQASLLMTLRDSELSIGELIDRGYHEASNVTRNVNQLIDAGYLDKNQSERTERSMSVRASEKGSQLCQSLCEMEIRHADSAGVEADNLTITRDSLNHLESLWSETVRSAHLEFARRVMTRK